MNKRKQITKDAYDEGRKAREKQRRTERHIKQQGQQQISDEVYNVLGRKV